MSFIQFKFFWLNNFGKLKMKINDKFGCEEICKKMKQLNEITSLNMNLMSNQLTTYDVIQSTCNIRFNHLEIAIF